MLQEPDRVKAGRIGHRERVAQDEGRVGKLGLQPVQREQRLGVGVRCVGDQRLAREGGRHVSAIGQKARRQVIDERHDHRRHCVHEQTMIGPVLDQRRGAGERRRQTRGCRLQALEDAHDQGGIAVDVGPDLQHGNAAIAAGQGREVRLRRHDRLLDRAPGQRLAGQHAPHLFGKR